ncbi:MAG: transcription antitermination factor NusB [Bacteroidia bacterium]
MFQSLFAHFKDENATATQIQKECRKSILGIEAHFYGVLAFLPELRQMVRVEQNPADRKYSASSEDAKLTFDLICDNPFLDQLEQAPVMKDFLKKPSIDWSQEKDLLLVIYKEIRQKDEFNALKAIEDITERSFKLAVLCYKHLIKESVDFEHFMEEQIIVWYDEKIPILKSLEKMFTSFEETATLTIPEVSRDLEEDLEFADILITEYMAHYTELEETLGKYTPGWDSDRIMKIDYVLMCMALCEFKFLPFVPVKVSINEYIEIAKMYSTPKSSKFLNGTLDKILKDWQSTGAINKTGRGLIG